MSIPIADATEIGAKIQNDEVVERLLGSRPRIRSTGYVPEPEGRRLEQPLLRPTRPHARKRQLVVGGQGERAGRAGLDAQAAHDAAQVVDQVVLAYRSPGETRCLRGRSPRPRRRSRRLGRRTRRAHTRCTSSRPFSCLFRRCRPTRARSGTALILRVPLGDVAAEDPLEADHIPPGTCARRPAEPPLAALVAHAATSSRAPGAWPSGHTNEQHGNRPGKTGGQTTPPEEVRPSPGKTMIAPVAGPNQAGGSGPSSRSSSAGRSATAGSARDQM